MAVKCLFKRLLPGILLGWSLWSSQVVQSQPAFPLPLALPESVSYDSAIPKPEEVIGHVVGTRHTAPHQIVAYFQAVAAASDRVLVEEHGRTYEGRPLIHAIVSAPENLMRLEEIRRANLRLSDDPASVSDAELARMPAVAYLGYSIHGNEASGSEASLLTLYYLAAARGPEIDSLLAQAVLIIDPMFNPDGRDRFVDWANRNRGRVPVADPQDREHLEPWPGGRTNHYWFDLNRDWLTGQHPESQGRLRLFHHWRPQLLTDHHEMGSESTFFFMPGVPSRTHPLTPARNQELTAAIARYHAEALNRIGSLYYSEEGYDDFYYGKGSTYPDANGAVGILFEQASSRALLRETRDGVLSYAFTIRNQFATSLSTLRALRALRLELLRYQRDFYREAEAIARRLPVKAYLIALEPGRTRAQMLAEVLRRHRIRVYTLARDVTVNGKTFRAGQAYVVPTQQPQVRMLQALMERRTTFEDSLFYDVSAWTLPLAYDVVWAEWRRDPSELLGTPVDSVRLDGGELVGGHSDYAYLMTWDRFYAPAALYRLQQAGVRARVLTEAVTLPVAGSRRTFPPGTVLIPVVQRDGKGPASDSLQALLRALADTYHVRFFAVQTGLTEQGPDLGTRDYGQVLEQPRVALLTGEGTRAYNAGEVWHLLSERMQMPVSLLDVDNVVWADLSRYNRLVLAGGSYSALPAEKIKNWVRQGGVLIALTDAVDWVVAQGLVSLKVRPFNLDSLLRPYPYGQLERARGAQVIGGAILEARLDTTHPLAFGLGATLPVFRTEETFYEPSETPGANVATYTEQPLRSGYLSAARQKQAPGAAAVVAQRYGRGRIILIMDNPNFRAFWVGSSRLFLNAICFGDAF
ncbi:M14 family metallopeptidase [Rhodothermus marinus]|uniref:Peptidase M14 carboxypeptidase A n=1 Tax=Rhodothermus marinus (strain ATCC 43812 / DSM 4252 / R-10) TaxID=518766 RepID=D0MHP3_RHOM4|nr:peptidase M14 carboxypeptidase A [Rhodothermus marinus DSM 4252]